LEWDGSCSNLSDQAKVHPDILAPQILTFVQLTFSRLTLDHESHWSKRLNKFPDAQEMRWLELLIDFPALMSDMLVILDCPVGHTEIGGRTMLDVSDGMLRFQVMIAGYEDSSFEPGAFTSCLAGLLENTTDPVNRMSRKEFITTAWVIDKLHNKNYLLDQEIEPRLILYSDKDDYSELIVLEPMLMPCIEHGSHHELSRYDQFKFFGNMLLIYENGLTEVFKARMFRRRQDANGTDEVVSAFVSISISECLSDFF
jgi:hypothetical protein